MRESSHPYFGPLTYFGSKNPGDSYWEAELSHPSLAKKIGVTMNGSVEGPEPSEEEFCRAVLADLNALFEKCRSAFESELPNWSKQPIPSDWREAFVLDGFSVPTHGKPEGEWELTYFVEPANHYFTARIEHGTVQEVLVDG